MHGHLSSLWSAPLSFRLTVEPSPVQPQLEAGVLLYYTREIEVDSSLATPISANGSETWSLYSSWTWTRYTGSINLNGAEES